MMINAALIIAIALGCVSQVSATNGTIVDNSTTCDYFATRTTYNASHDLCVCESGYSGNGTTCALTAQLDCKSDVNDGYAFKVYLNQTFVDFYGYPQDSLALLNASCGGAVLENGYYVLTSPTYDACGSVRTNNSENVIYSNAVMSHGGVVSTGGILYLPFSCFVVAFLNISLTGSDNDTIPILLEQTTGSKIEFPVSGVGGKVTAGMYLFQDTDYANPYNGIPVLTTSDMLYAQIALESPVYAVSLIARECWATPESTGTSSERFNIIEEPGCLNTQANNAKLTSNGVTWYSRFQFQVFMFMPSNVAYIHCDIELCYLTGGRTCQPTCSASGRRKRSLNSKQIRSSAIIRAKEHIEPPPVVHPVATTTVQPSQVWDTLDPLFIIIASVVAVLLLAVVALAVFFCSNRKKSGKVDKAQPLPKSHFPI